jgi:ADP-ribose pyrophosphatase
MKTILLELRMPIKKGPWTVLETNRIYKNAWVTLDENKVIRPDGKDGIYGIVTLNCGSTVLPIDSEGNVYLVEQYRFAMEKKTIEAISGGIKPGENPEEAAIREMREEVGIIAKKLTSLGVIDPLTSAVYGPSNLFIAQDLTIKTANPDGDERINIIKVPFAKALEWVNDGTITQSSSVILILKVRTLIDEGSIIWK